MKVIFVDRFCLSSLFRTLRTAHSCESVYHFDCASGTSRLLLSVMRRIGYMHFRVEKINGHVGQIKNENGEGQYVRLLTDARSIVSTIAKTEVRENPLIKAIGGVWASDKVAWHFEKEIEHQIQMECLRIGLVLWLLRTKIGKASSEALILIERNPWLSYIEDYARLRGIRLIEYRRLCDGSWILDVCFRSGKALGRLGRTFWVAARNRIRTWLAPVFSSANENNSGSPKELSGSRLAIHYWFRSLSLKPTERSEFFWLEGSRVPWSEILLYGYVADKQIDQGTADELDKRGIRVLGRAPGIATWIPTVRMPVTFLRTLGKLIVGVFACVRQGYPVPVFHVRRLVALAWEYAYWYDFFVAHRVRVNVGTLNTSVGQVLALDALNGMSVAYQYSVSPILCPTSLLSSGEDVQFVFSRAFEDLWRSMEAPVTTYVRTGFIYDGAIPAIRGLRRVGEVRKQLRESGAQYVLCFFDENSLDQWDFYANHEGAADDYEYLLKWLMADPTLGIVFKPKKSASLFQRIGRVSCLVDEAKKTGRCKFFASDGLVGSVFPAEAAMVADVCVGKLDGATAALEARLAGVPTVLIDAEGFRAHPFYTWGKNRVVFDSWDSLRSTIERYRCEPELCPEFGDWSPGIGELDPFRDGGASLRMGLYIAWVYDALKKGASKEDALRITSSQFAERWTKEHLKTRS